jgi:hypothetical protein
LFPIIDATADKFVAAMGGHATKAIVCLTKAKRLRCERAGKLAREARAKAQRPAKAGRCKHMGLP